MPQSNAHIDDIFLRCIDTAVTVGSRETWLPNRTGKLAGNLLDCSDDKKDKCFTAGSD